MNNFPKIEAFPDDTQLRLIWWYGPVFKNNSNSSVPLVKILTKLLTPDGVAKGGVPKFVYQEVFLSWIDPETKQSYFETSNAKN